MEVVGAFTLFVGALPYGRQKVGQFDADTKKSSLFV